MIKYYTNSKKLKGESMKTYLIILLILATILAGCSAVLTDKEQVEAIHVKNIKAVINGDAKLAAKDFSPDYIDFKRGPLKLDEAYFNNTVFTTQFYKEKIKGKTVKSLFDLNKKFLYNYDEVMNSSYKEEGKGQWFEYKQGDIIINYPPK